MPSSRMPPRAVSVTASSHPRVVEHPAGAARPGVVAGLDQLAVDVDAVGVRPADDQAGARGRCGRSSARSWSCRWCRSPRPPGPAGVRVVGRGPGSDAAHPRGGRGRRRRRRRRPAARRAPRRPRGRAPGPGRGAATGTRPRARCRSAGRPDAHREPGGAGLARRPGVRPARRPAARTAAGSPVPARPGRAAARPERWRRTARRLGVRQRQQRRDVEGQLDRGAREVEVRALEDPQLDQRRSLGVHGSHRGRVTRPWRGSRRRRARSPRWCAGTSPTAGRRRPARPARVGRRPSPAAPGWSRRPRTRRSRGSPWRPCVLQRAGGDQVDPDARRAEVAGQVARGRLERGLGHAHPVVRRPGDRRVEGQADHRAAGRHQRLAAATASALSEYAETCTRRARRRPTGLEELAAQRRLRGEADRVQHAVEAVDVLADPVGERVEVLRVGRRRARSPAASVGQPLGDRLGDPHGPAEGGEHDLGALLLGDPRDVEARSRCPSSRR